MAHLSKRYDRRIEVVARDDASGCNKRQSSSHPGHRASGIHGRVRIFNGTLVTDADRHTCVPESRTNRPLIRTARVNLATGTSAPISCARLRRSPPLPPLLLFFCFLYIFFKPTPDRVPEGCTVRLSEALAQIGRYTYAWRAHS